MRTADGYIISQCLDGNSAAFGVLVDRYKESIYALAYSMLHDLHEAEDITQEAFIKAYEKLHTLKRYDSFHAWLFAITANLCKNWIKSRSRRPDREFIEDQDGQILEERSMDHYRDKLVYQSVHDAMKSLPETYCQVLSLHYLSGMETRAIARFLGTTPTAVRHRLRRARARLGEEMIAMMQTTLEGQKLPVGFTLRIVETVKRLRIQPLSRNPGLPWGISLAAGIIIAVLSIGSNLNLTSFPIPPLNPENTSEAEMTEVGEIPVDVLRTSLVPASFGRQGDNHNGSFQPSDLQNSTLMAPRGDGGDFPEEPSVRLGKGTLGRIAYSPDGKLLAVACGVGIRLYDTVDLNEVALLPGYSYGVIAFSPDGKLLASAVSWLVNEIHLWDITEKKQIGILDIGGYVYSLAFSPDGTILASGGQDKLIPLWDVREQKQIGALKGHTIDRIRSVAFSPDGEILASGSDDNTIRLWDVQEQREIGLLQGHTAAVQSVAFSSDGRTLASGSSDKTIRLWDVQEQKQTGVLKGHTETLWSVAFSPDGKNLASASYDKTIRLWDIQEQKQAREPLENQSSPRYVVFSPDGKTLASGDRSGSIRFWDVQEWKQTEAIEGFTNNFIYSLAFSPDGNILASGGSYEEILLWDIQEQKKIGYLEEGFNSAGASSLAFTPDGKTIASIYREEINLYSVQTQEKLGTLEGHTDSVRSIVFSPDGQTLISGGLDQTVRIWDVAEQKEIVVLENGSHAHCIAISPEGKTIAAAIGGEGLVRLWDAETHKEIGILKHPQGAAMSVSFSPDGKTLASGNASGLIYLWDYAENKLIGQLQGDIQLRENPTWAYPYFSPDEKLLAAIYWEGFALIWDIQEQQQISMIQGHYVVRAVTFSPDGKWLATAGDEGTVLLWEVNLTVPGRSIEPTGKQPVKWGQLKRTELYQNYPNPFNPETWIPFRLAQDTDVNVRIYNMAGQVIREIKLGHQQAGVYTGKDEAAYWDGRNEAGELAVSGIYFYSMGTSDLRKMVMIR